ncbi:hypothetical protein AVEN_169323-1 [Araneus ventricosus]|uniref:Uncharacterized protein n=1 Tax=Araneus ventricosus TaxID=182803 RepID=A0A4Y2P332_ARAVE|nr:hypothetical protein AVEN_169323-1 [Araneus ventricosus]
MDFPVLKSTEKVLKEGTENLFMTKIIKYHHTEHCKFYKKESKQNQEAKYVCEPTFSAPESSENESNSCDEIDYLKSWIFRDTDDEDEEFQGFTEEDLHSNAEVITKKCFKKERTDEHSRRENNGKTCIMDKMQRYRRCSSPVGRDEDEGMFSNAESDGEMDMKWFTHVMKVLESSIEKDENDENDQRILRQNLNKVFGLNKEDDIMLQIVVKK